MEGITRRRIDGKWYVCQDVGCQDFKGAEQNRVRIAQGFAKAFWKRFEEDPSILNEPTEKELEAIEKELPFDQDTTT